VAIESRWLYHILTNKLDVVHNYIHYMFKREDYKRLFFELYKNLYINVWNEKFIIFLKKASTYDNNKTYECINYQNETGNTVIHLMAKCHDKQTLQFCVNYFCALTFGPNNEGKTPLVLYNESKLKNKLK
jgi:hypothetical protein